MADDWEPVESTAFVSATKYSNTQSDNDWEPSNNKHGSNQGNNNNGSWGASQENRPRRQPRPGDWSCSCGQSNFASRSDCYKCKSPKPEGADESTGGNNNGWNGSSGGWGNSGGGETGKKFNRPGDWTCSCGQSNFASRSECYKCKTQKPEGADGASGGGWGGSGGNESSKRASRPSDWVCPCGVSNFANRTECFKCSAAKPANAERASGDWKCSCGEKNDANQSNCTKCDSEKPADAIFHDEKPKEFYIPAEKDDQEIFNSGISSGINFDKYDNIPVHLNGDNLIPPCDSFESAGLSNFLTENITRCNYKKPTPIQKYAIPIINAGRDMMGCAQTGSGKTAAFLVPIIDTLLKQNVPCNIGKPNVVIVSPTRELAIQIYEEARKFAAGSFVKTCVIYGGTATRHQSTNISKGCHILVATPGRLKDFVNKTYITFEDVLFLVLDEADRMLDLGFKPAVEEIVKNPTMPVAGQRRTLMFSATFPEEIQIMAGEYLKDYLFLTVGIVGGACHDVEQKLFKVGKFEKRNKLMEIFNNEDPKGTIVFVETKRNADFLASFLSESKHPTTSIHGDRMQRQREEALSDFKSGKMKVLIATSVAARGLDIPNVNHVINYELPKSIDDYVHRIGRTGRVGNRGKATSFYDPEVDSALRDHLVRILNQAEQTIPDFLAGGAGCGDINGNDFGGQDYRKQPNTVPTNTAATAGGEDDDWN